MYYSGEFEYSPEEDYILSSAIDYLRIKLREELREDKGGVYGVGISGGGSNVPVERYSITISFNSDPGKTQELVDAAQAVIKKAKQEGPSDKDMTKVKETQRQSKIKNLENNRYWANMIESLHEDGRSFNEILLPSFDQKVNNLTAQQIQDAIVQYFDHDYIEIIMEPKEEPQN